MIPQIGFTPAGLIGQILFHSANHLFNCPFYHSFFIQKNRADHSALSKKTFLGIPTSHSLINRFDQSILAVFTAINNACAVCFGHLQNEESYVLAYSFAKRLLHYPSVLEKDVLYVQCLVLLHWFLLRLLSVVNKSPLSGATKAVSRDLRLIFVLNLRFGVLIYQQPNQYLHIDQEKFSSARKTRNGNGMVYFNFCCFSVYTSN